MPSFFSHRMPSVPDDKQIETASFLQGAKELMPFLEMLGAMFKPVRSDIDGNIKILDAIYQKNPEKYKTFRAMLEDEKGKVDTTKGGSATCSLLWLKRGCEYISLLMRLIAQDAEKKESLTEFVQKAYVQTLQDYHSWIVKQVFRAVSHAAPYRKDLLVSLGVSEDVTEEQVLKDMVEYSDSMDANTTVIHQLLVDLDLYSDARA